MTPSRTLARELPAGLVAGLLGGLVFISLAVKGICPLTGAQLGTDTPFLDLGIGVGVGLLFALLAGPHAAHAGAGLLWGMAFGLAWWIAGPLTVLPLFRGLGGLGGLGGDQAHSWSIETARDAFPLLPGYLVGYGAVLGTSYPLLLRLFGGARSATTQAPAVRGVISAAPTLLRSAVLGTLAGLIAGAVFGSWMDEARVSMARTLTGASPLGTVLVHFLASAGFGTAYAVLFRHETQSLGSSLAWGFAFGFVAWVIGPLTLVPTLTGEGVRWSLVAARDTFALLTGHVLYGVLLGGIYAALDHLWRLLMTDSDPLSRSEREGPGARTLRALGEGALAGLVGLGGLLLLVPRGDFLRQAAGLLGASAPVAGLAVAFGTAALLGALYAFLFRLEGAALGATLGWGMVYGLIWWFLGPLTLATGLTGGATRWSNEAAEASFPLLGGLLAWGATTALVYHVASRARARKQRRLGVAAPPLAASSTGPALWVLVTTLGIALPILLAP